VAEHRNRASGEEGFTLVELLTVILITGFICASIVGVVTSVARAERTTLDLANNLDSARIAVDRVRDVIRASYAICDDSTAQQLRLWRNDTDKDRRVDADEITRLTLGGGELRRVDGSGTARLIAFGVGASSFTFTDKTGNPVAPAQLPGKAVNCASTADQTGAGTVTTVNFSLSGDRAPAGRTTPTVVTSQITLRNAVFLDGSIEPNRSPRASFTFTCAPPVCTFDASASHDEDGSISEYAWQFGTLATAGVVNPTYEFPLTDGTYPVTLTVLDNRGASATSTQFVTIRLDELNPAGKFTYTCTQLTCTFSGASITGTDGDVVSYEWSFGDGSPDASGKVVSHSYAAAGSYTATLTVVDSSGASGSHSQLVNPNTGTGQFLVSLTDVSTAFNTNIFYARVQISVRNSDGSPAVGVEVSGRFGGETSPLVAQDTNAQGSATLQANGDYTKGTTLNFTVVKVKGGAVPGPTITLKYPG
jgi:PKD repeat protein